MQPRNSYFSEQIRNESFRQILSDKFRLNEIYLNILDLIFTVPDGLTMQEIGERLGKPASEISARLNELRNEELVITPGKKKKNPVTGKSNTLWLINPVLLEPTQISFFN